MSKNGLTKGFIEVFWEVLLCSGLIKYDYKSVSSVEVGYDMILCGVK